jgi:hypothetical protein
LASSRKRRRRSGSQRIAAQPSAWNLTATVDLDQCGAPLVVRQTADVASD